MVDPLQTLARPRYNGLAAGQPSTVDAGTLRPHRSPGRLLFGLLLAAVTVLVFVVVAQRADDKRPVLAVARPVAAGQQLTAADLVAVRVSVEDGVPVVPASQLDQIVGHTAAVPLVRGALLAPRQVGPAAWPPAGQAVLALPVKAGHSPSGLATGATVMVLISPPTGSGNGGMSGGVSGPSGSAQQAAATVVAVERASDGTGAAVLSLLLTQDAAVRLAGTSGGEVSVVLLAPQR